MVNQNAIGSGRLHKSKLVELINRDSSRTSSNKHKESSETSVKNKISNSYRNNEVRIKDVELNIEDPKHDNPNNSFEERDSLNDAHI